MTTQRIIGAVFLILGVVLMIIGFSASESFADQANEFFTGKFTDSTMWYILGGGALALLGFFSLLFRTGKAA